MEKIKVGMLGIGNIGKGTYKALAMNQKKIADTTGLDIEIVKILNRHPEKDRGIDIPREKYTTDVDDILNDPEISIVVELIGGIEPATTFMARALENGKSVVTANKAAIAANGRMLAQLAQEHHVLLRFEAAVAGGIPILTSLTTALLSNEFSSVHGILNGTTNYMLTKMFYEGADYASVLKEAQDNGYAERNPEADVEGYDACRKIAILSSLISGQQVDFEDIYCEGITKITVEDMRYAKAMGTTIKLLASSKTHAGRLGAMVAPCMLYPDHPLYNVNGVFNAIFVHGNVLGDAMFYGSGAGKLPTASAVVSDVVEAAKNLNRNVMTMWKEEKLRLEDKSSMKRRFFIRMKGNVEEKIEDIRYSFGNVEIVKVDGLDGEFGFVTPIMMKGDYDTRAKSYEDQILHMIRIED